MTPKEKQTVQAETKHKASSRPALGEEEQQSVLELTRQAAGLETQCAFAQTDLGLLEQKHREDIDRELEWRRKSQLAASKGDLRLARSAQARALNYQQSAAACAAQMERLARQAEQLRQAHDDLILQLSEVRARNVGTKN